VQDRPSIFGSAVKITFSSFAKRRNRRTRSTNSATSASENALPSDSIATLWRTLANFCEGCAPTRREGESSRTSSGKRASISSLRRRSAS